MGLLLGQYQILRPWGILTYAAFSEQRNIRVLCEMV